MSAGASFSSGPHTGKLNALTCTATPRQRGEQVLAEELPRLAELLGRSLDKHALVRQLAPGLAGVAEQHPDAAVDVELRVAQRRAGAEGELVQLLPVLAQQLADRLRQLGPLVEGHGPQRGTAGGPAVGQGGAEVDPLGGNLGDHLTGHRVVHRGPAGRRVPAAFDVTAQYGHQRSSHSVREHCSPRTRRGLSRGIDFTYRSFGNLLCCMENDQAAAEEIVTVEVKDAVGVVTMRTPALSKAAKERLLAALRQA